MLPLGHIGIRAERGDDRTSRFTHDEAQTVMTLWSIAQSPLMFGGDLPSTDTFTLSLLTNDEVVAVNQHGANAYPVSESGDRIIWTADAPEAGSKYLAVFNLGASAADIRVDWSTLKLPELCTLRDLWKKSDVGKTPGGFTFHVPAHGSELYKLGAR
jgi:hypothetical protein